MDIEKAKNRCNELVKVEHANWIGISNQEAIETVLNELDNKDKIINEMAEQLAGLAIFDGDIEEATILEDTEQVIDFFTKKVEGK